MTPAEGSSELGWSLPNNGLWDAQVAALGGFGPTSTAPPRIAGPRIEGFRSGSEQVPSESLVGGGRRAAEDVPLRAGLDYLAPC